MNRYKTVIIPAQGKFSEVLAGKVDRDVSFAVVGITAYGDILQLTRELVDMAYNAGYADCEDKHLHKLKVIENLKAGGNK